LAPSGQERSELLVDVDLYADSNLDLNADLVADANAVAVAFL